MIDAATRGAVQGGAEVDEIRLCDYKLLKCQVCDEGWGTSKNGDTICG